MLVFCSDQPHLPGGGRDLAPDMLRFGVTWGRLGSVGGSNRCQPIPTDRQLTRLTANQPNQRPTDSVHMVSPHVEGAESGSSLRLPQFPGCRASSGAKP